MIGAKVLSPSNYEEIKGSLIRWAIDKGEPDPTQYEIAKAISKISFKAGQEYALSKEGHEAISYLEGHQSGEKQGYEKGYNKALAQLADMTEECKQIGRKEVVEWIDGNGIWAQVPFKVKESEETMWCLFPNEWQSFKKKLGL